MKYQHTQIGKLMLIAAIIILFISGYLLKMEEAGPIPGVIITLVIVILLSFSSLKVTIDENNLQIKFGWGIYRKKFNLDEITSVKAVKNPWYFGWGIRFWLWPRMTIFNVSGFDAIEVKLKNGKIYRIGTDEPEKLETAIIEASNFKINK